MLRRASSLVIAFGRFWYHFIVGDDWVMAAAVIVGLAVTASLLAHGISAWWLMPALVIGMLGVSLRRAHARSNR
jgi:hypothetical protein